MPYSTTDELPKNVKDSLPDEKALETYREAFNSAWKQYQDSSKRRDQESQEEVAHKVAWSAVKKNYKRVSEGEWQPK